MSIIHTLLDSEGMKFLDRMHERSFSINVFRLNARDLINHLSTAEDLGKAMATFNSPVSREEMTECVRLIHNFLASATTLIDHTRIFFKTHYPNTEINRVYREAVSEKFERNESTRFVQDMRNFMLHKGLLPLERHMTFERDQQTGEQMASTGFQLKVLDLLEWQNWKPEVRKYLKRQPKKIDLLPVVNEYTRLIEVFHGDLDERLKSLHSSDLILMQAFQQQLDEERVPRTSPAPQQSL
jgi:hypothetical protein